MNDTEREMWVDNDEGLYRLMRGSGQAKRAFVRANRMLIDEVISNITNNRKPAHYLASYLERMERKVMEYAEEQARMVLGAYPSCHGIFMLRCNTAKHLAKQKWQWVSPLDRYIDGTGIWTVFHKNGKRYRITRETSGAVMVETQESSGRNVWARVS